MSNYAPKMTAANNVISPTQKVELRDFIEETRADGSPTGYFIFRNEYGRRAEWSPDQLIAAAQYVIGVQAKTDENGFVLRDNQRPEIASLLDALDSAGAYARRGPMPEATSHFRKHRRTYALVAMFIGISIAAISTR